MPHEFLEPSAMKYAFVVYDPPAPGLPWLSVCVGPAGKIFAMEAFNTLEGAQARTAECAETFIRELDDKRKVVAPARRPASVH
jgi:hypothetical protein